MRQLPPRRSFLIAAGLEQALDYLANLRFTADEIGFLRGQPVFKNVSQEFFAFLKDLRFTGEVSAMPEGTVAFANEPLLRVTAPIIEAQLVEAARLDSGDLVSLSKQVRKILDDGGMTGTKIFTSGDLDEDRIAELLDADAYSVFSSVDETGRSLDELLRGRGVKALYLVGFATDYCVRATVLDGLKLGYEVNVSTDGVRAVNDKPEDDGYGG